MYRICYVYLKDKAEAVDAAADVFVKALTGSAEFDGGEIDGDTLKSYYSLDTDKISSYFAEESSLSFLHPDTVIILEVKDGYSSTAVDLLNPAFAPHVDKENLVTSLKESGIDDVVVLYGLSNFTNDVKIALFE